MGLVCDSLNMCKKREEFVCAYPELAKTLKPDFCPFCGKKWYASAICDNAILTSAIHSDSEGHAALNKAGIPGDEETFNNGTGW